MFYRRVAMIKHKILRTLGGTAFLLLPLMGLGLAATSCSKEETEASEWDNWQQRNVKYTNYIADCYQTNATPELAPQGLGWKRLKAYSKDTATEGGINEYVYAYVIEEGSGSVSPAFTDSVRVIYQGRLIPTSTYTEGYVFDGTVNNTFSMNTSATACMKVSKTVDGFSTALQYMHRGDRWRVYIPYELGYGEEDQKNSSGVVTVPGSSMLIFDLQLIDFCPASETLPVWRSRQR